jgi:peroxiredoxin
MAELSRFHLHTGDPAPPFSLPGTDGKTHRLDDYRSDRLLAVLFWCNHCPYVQAWESRTIELARKYAGRGVGFVTINANDPTSYPDDRFEMMVERARSKRYPFPYLHDATQEVAHAYGALVTPHPMLFDAGRRLVFQGRIDDSYDHPERVRERFLDAAIEASLSGKPVPHPEVSVQGCSVKWRD